MKMKDALEIAFNIMGQVDMPDDASDQDVLRQEQVAEDIAFEIVKAYRAGVEKGRSQSGPLLRLKKN